MTTPRIYTAVYSGVAVFEMVVNNITIMRRRVDSHMNATQILKVAGIEKGKRTKILEREILPGEHEKVQGGYGKFQGTWIPLQTSIDLAKRYNVYDLVKPMIEFNPATAGNIDEKGHVLTKEQAQLYDKQTQPSKKKRELRELAIASGSSSALPSGNSQQQQQRHMDSGDTSRVQKKARIDLPPSIEPTASDNSAESKHRAILMSIFLSDDNVDIPDLLRTSEGIDLDLALDEQGNTSLHWASALARLNTVEQLISHGADVCRQNYHGETPLMQSVAATNNFDRDCFRKLLKLLENSMYITDHKHRSVIHHTVLTTGISGRDIAALYYMHHLLHHLDKKSPPPAHQSSSPVSPSASRGKLTLLNMQDSQGDTALSIAARLECKRMVELLVDAGADPASENNLGLVVNDYTMSEQLSKSTKETTSYDNDNTDQTLKVPPSATLFAKRSVGSSQRGKEIVATVQKIVDALDEEYGGQLSERETQLKETEEQLEKTTQALEAARKELERRQEQSQLLAEGQQKVRNLNQALETGWHELEVLLQKNNETLDKEAVLQFDVDQNIDSMFDIKNDNVDKVIQLRARISAYTLNNNALKTYVDGLRAETAEKELQCKRLIAACCSLPIDKIDELVEPLTLAIESDPPDLDLARVIGFMEKIRRQGAFNDTGSDDLPHVLPSSSSKTTSQVPASPGPSSSTTSTSYDGLSRSSNNVATSHIRTSSQPLQTNSP
ncbi:uncharacterized protein BX664DRAFT_290228 [Halteromyces radiatus]|uniref:uncharacterized protein n=1 Tax=Halteromyces radiatus TaxID=101107 RepID=UPI00221F5447|nr:uncharacterized protein BX664DRAFT_290228 [Halteromyces radiatus]KAI8099856.1 hypothetical protein BX664DRAFT_290228 [Halteromyces radiatus]